MAKDKKKETVEEPVVAPVSDEERIALEKELESEKVLLQDLQKENAALREDLNASSLKKPEELRDEYSAALAKANEAATENTEEEVRIMGLFTDEVVAFNRAAGDYSRSMAKLKALTEGK